MFDNFREVNTGILRGCAFIINILRTAVLWEYYLNASQIGLMTG